MARPGRVCHGGHLGLQWCNDQKEKTRPPAFSSGTWAGEGDQHEPIAWQGAEDHAKLHSCIAPAPVSSPPWHRTPLSSCLTGSPQLTLLLAEAAASPRCRLPKAGIVHPLESPAAPMAPRPSPDPQMIPAPAAPPRDGGRQGSAAAATQTSAGFHHTDDASPREGEPLPKGEGASQQQTPPVQNNSHLLVHTANTR